MIVERHYDDETLIGLLGSSAEALTDPHLAICSTCSDTLASYQAIATVLGDEAAWDLRDLRHEPDPQTIETLRRFSTELAGDDAQASALVEALLSRPRAEWTAAISDLRYLSPAVVRALVAASEKELERSPAGAFDVAMIAVRIGDAISADAESSDVVRRACGAAWRQYAYSAFYIGEYNRTAEGVQRARASFEACAVSDYELARVDIVLSLLLTVQERYAEAVTVATKAAQVFESFGDRQRVASARIAAADALAVQMRYREAMAIFQTIESEFCSDVDSDTRARVFSNMALCQIELNENAEAMNNLQIAAAIFDELGNVADAARNRYYVASMLAANGRPEEAKKRLRSLRAEFQNLGMAHLAVSAGLDLAEILLIENAHQEAESLCADAIRLFRGTGLSATTQGLTALGYLQEAIAQRRATPQAARYVRKYIERLPNEPELLFVPPPAVF